MSRRISPKWSGSLTSIIVDLGQGRLGLGQIVDPSLKKGAQIGIAIGSGCGSDGDGEPRKRQGVSQHGGAQAVAVKRLDQPLDRRPGTG